MKKKKEREFMPAYDLNDDDGSAKLNLRKAAQLPAWRKTFKIMFDNKDRIMGKQK